jgi:hypothetical protein
LLNRWLVSTRSVNGHCYHFIVISIFSFHAFTIFYYWQTSCFWLKLHLHTYCLRTPILYVHPSALVGYLFASCIEPMDTTTVGPFFMRACDKMWIVGEAYHLGHGRTYYQFVVFIAFGIICNKRKNMKDKDNNNLQKIDFLAS